LRPGLIELIASKTSTVSALLWLILFSCSIQ